jgi:metal-responsive CopG/Arc/MetJ family transcriptional regulator
MAKSIKLNSDLWQRIEEHAKKAGYSSPEEFIEHVLEKELSKDEDVASQEEVERRLKGLGYLE